MKTKNLFGILILFLLTFSFISCDKDDLTDKVGKLFFGNAGSCP